MIRILHVAETLPGGIATYLNTLLPYQIAHYGPGQVALLAPEEQVGHLAPGIRSRIQLYTYVRRDRSPLALARLCLAFHRAVRAHRPNLIHAHSSFAGGIVRATGLRNRVPVIYCPHGWSFDAEQPAWQRALRAAIERKLGRRAAAIIAISEHERLSAIRNGISPDKVHRIYYGLDATGAADRCGTGLDQGPLRLLFVGRLDQQKGLDWLLEVMAKLPKDRVRLTVAGTPINDQDARFPQVAGVHYAGWVAHEALAEYYDDADAIIVPSRWEGFGLVVIEAMRRSVAALVSDRGALPEVSGPDAGDLVFSLERPDDLARLLLGVDRARLREIGKAGRARFERLFTCERMAMETDKLYNDVLSNWPAMLGKEHARAASDA